MSSLLSPQLQHRINTLLNAKTLYELAAAFGLLHVYNFRADPTENEEIVGETAKEYFDYALKEPQRYVHFINKLFLALAGSSYNSNRAQVKVILDVGCGTGILTAEIAKQFPGAKVYGIDLSTDMVGLANSYRRNLPLDLRSRLSFKTGSVYNLPELLNSWGIQETDILITRHVFHRLKRIEFAFKQILEATRIGGLIYASSFFGDLDSKELIDGLVDNTKRRIQGSNGDIYYNFAKCYLSAVLCAPTRQSYEEIFSALIQKYHPDSSAIHFQSLDCEIEIIR